MELMDTDYEYVKCTGLDEYRVGMVEFSDDTSVMSVVVTASG
jgi:hypothetical protein